MARRYALGRFSVFEARKPCAVASFSLMLNKNILSWHREDAADDAAVFQHVVIVIAPLAPEKWGPVVKSVGIKPQ
jgi:hypothetical protein